MSADSSQSGTERAFEEIGALKHQMEGLSRDLESLKVESKKGIRTWGVYLGIIATMLAVPRAAKDVFDAFYKHSDFSVLTTEVPLTLYYDDPHQTLSFTFPVIATNNGNLDGIIVGATAHFEPPLMDATEAHFRFVDETNKQVAFPFTIATGVSKSLTGSVDFTGPGLTVPGRHIFEVSLIGDDRKPLSTMPIRFCVDVSKELVVLISGASQRILGAQCQ